MATNQPSLIIPTGTQVVACVAAQGSDDRSVPPGAVGVIVAAPGDDSAAYRVRFADGTEAVLRREELSIRKEHQPSTICSSGCGLRWEPEHISRRSYTG